MRAVTTGEWIDALRSGDYEQGVGTLNRDGKFCCIGVLCDLIDPDGWTNVRDVDPQGTYFATDDKTMVFGSTMAVTTPPYEIFKDLKFAFELDLIKMNDHEGASFTEIAEKIEETWGRDRVIGQRFVEKYRLEGQQDNDSTS